MSEALPMSNPRTCEDSSSAISSPASASGATPSVSPDGPTLDLFGQAVVPASPSRSQVNAPAAPTIATSGRIGRGSSASQALQKSLESRLKRRLDMAGSTLFRMTWKRLVTPSGRLLSRLAASGLRTSGKGCTSVPTPNTPSGGPNVKSTATHTWGMDLDGVATMAKCTCPTECDCQSPDTEPALCSNECPIHNLYPKAALDCPIHGENAPSDPKWRASLVPEALRSPSAAQLSAVPTPNAMEGGQTSRSGKRKGELLMGGIVQLASVCSPTAQDCSRGGKPARPWDTGVPLTQQVALAVVTTPSARDWKDSPGMSLTAVNPDGSERTRLDLLPRQAQLAASGPDATGGGAETGSTGQLNPDYSLWLMALPPEFSSCAERAMASLRRRRQCSPKRGKKSGQKGH